mmetsp:Transcript_14100/g.12448  ORF Transcript_14100/g.12448 Transcript_14100/m.12448 type:complete len:87 (+) Transcript_14100:43-303(+)
MKSDEEEHKTPLKNNVQSHKKRIRSFMKINKKKYKGKFKKKKAVQMPLENHLQNKKNGSLSNESSQRFFSNRILVKTYKDPEQAEP